MKQIIPKLNNAIIYAMAPGFFAKLHPEFKVDVSEKALDVFEELESVDPGVTAWDSAGLIRMPSGERYGQNDSHISFVVQVNERKLPAKVRDELVQKKAEVLSNQQGRKVSKKEYRLLIEEAEMELLPKAFIGRSQTLISFTDKDKLIVWTTSAKRAERMTGIVLAWIEGILPKAEPMFRNIVYRHEQATVFTRMVKTSPGDNDVLCDGFNAVLKGESEVIRVRNCDLSSSDVQDLLRNEDSYKVVEMQMIYDSASNFGSTDHIPEMTFTVNEGMIFKKIVIPGVEVERGENVVDAFDSQLFITMQTLLKAHAALGEELGGEGGSDPVYSDDDEI